MKRNALALTIVAFWGVCGAAVVTAQTDIKSVDFKNFTYEPYCAGEKTLKVTVKNGEFSEEKKVDNDITERLYFNVDKITYGDVNGDGQDDAIVLTVCNTGGTGNFSEGFVYTMENGKPALLTRIEGGDRAYGGLREARVENGLLAVERNDVGENGGACCAEFAETTNYRLEQGKLVKVGKPLRRELYPATRVSFEKGAASRRITARIPTNQFKRFAVDARAGQTLTVTSGMKDVSVTLYKGEATETELAGGLKARLQKNGDYIFSVANNAEAEREISFTVEIK